ncbi:FAD-binding oxidoreductase [Arthrobacter sp. NEB 688]|uniref:FAD-binding oxidoreductase n=1 Tax=Arthrobacter sp. NEB 688 TaxID=904039 RepID=UPI001563FFBF|nr:FAD-binding oxidoreductase [Arthrobacter sp. NEB 688]QKE84671.1 FAD-binding oxidoreductase [Arthrobacter sp. NEB 688]
MSTVAVTAHDAGVERLLASHRAIPAGAPVRLAKRTSNLFRGRTPTGVPGLDTSGLGGVVSVDPDAGTADVQGMCTYEDLVDATLPHGLTPLVVPQLRTITLGGAVTGLGIESASWRNGLPHESVLEMDVLTGSGEVLTCDATDRHPDLFHGFPNSYGTLGYATRLRIELEPVGRTVSLRHVRFHDLDALLAAVDEVMTNRAYDGEDVDYVDGVVFSAAESYLVLGRRSDEPGPTSDYTGQQVFYRSIRHDRPRPTRDTLSTLDYLWRWDTDWFWCSRAFGAQHPALRRVWPRRWLRSSAYWRLVALDRRLDVADRLEARRGRPARERVVQDVEIPLGRTAEFLRWFLREVPIEPIWLCPLQLRDERTWTLYPLRPGERYVNVGFWSTVPVDPTQPRGAANRRIEDAVDALGGHKSLYSEAFYDEETFWRHYGGDHYPALKERYDPGHRLPDLYAKAVRGA